MSVLEIGLLKDGNVCFGIGDGQHSAYKYLAMLQCSEYQGPERDA
jgi:hypothetical protein